MRLLRASSRRRVENIFAHVAGSSMVRLCSTTIKPVRNFLLVGSQKTEGKLTALGRSPGTVVHAKMGR